MNGLGAKRGGDVVHRTSTTHRVNGACAMNATVSGKPVWAVLHGVAPHVARLGPRVQTAFATVLDMFSFTFPCSACQASVGPFLDESLVVVDALRGIGSNTSRESGKNTTRDSGKHDRHGALCALAARGDAPLLLRTLHACVERKLARQRWEAVTQTLGHALALRLGAAQDEASVIEALEAAGRDVDVGAAVIKVPTEHVEALRDALDTAATGAPFPVAAAWEFLAITVFFHDTARVEDGKPLPPPLLRALRAFSVLVAPWFPADAERIDALAAALDVQDTALQAGASYSISRERRSWPARLRGGASRIETAAVFAAIDAELQEHLRQEALAATRLIIQAHEAHGHSTASRASVRASPLEPPEAHSCLCARAHASTSPLYAFRATALAALGHDPLQPVTELTASDAARLEAFEAAVANVRATMCSRTTCAG
jgi:hypothetical protein